MYDLKLSRLPLLNVRDEFSWFYRLLASPSFAEQGKPPHEVFDAGFFMSRYDPEALLTLILQRGILGIESYVLGAVFMRYSIFPGANLDMLARLEDPYSLGGRGTAENVYNRAPVLIDERHALSAADPALWERTKVFYRQVRNPLFHGYQLDRWDPHAVLRAYSHIRDLYVWVDGWWDVRTVFGARPK